MKKTNFALTASILCAAFNANALGVDSLIKVMDSKRDVINVSNSDGFRQFVNMEISDVSVVNGNLINTPYTKENISSWTLELRPNKMILDNGQTKKVSLRYTGEEIRERDKVYSLSITPTPYYSEGDALPNTVQMVVGFAPYVIVPATIDSPLAYKIEYKEDHVLIHNTGNTYFRAFLKVCDSTSLKVPASQCAADAYVLSGRKMQIKLPDRVKDNANITLRTNNSQYKDSFSIKAGQVRTR
ncbi:hypothetical protein [Vibrio campbellii]|uniref:hypothetical protein n=1 Tax=Vibrio campbellii TaxID=680 RepID=UPI000CD34FF4|nr:hypothetical protein [Vibrio campbellii]AUW07485.1 hypothetical protein C1N51_28080 [Vibrio campbellii]